jgi:competence protein ComEC
MDQTWPRPVCALTIAFVMALVLERMGSWPHSHSFLGWTAVVAGALLVLHFIALRANPPLRLPILSLLLFCALGVLAQRVATPASTAGAGLDPFLRNTPTLFLAEVVAAPDPQPEKTRLTLHLHRAYPQLGSVPLGIGALLTVRDCRKRWLPGQLLLARLSLKRIRGFHDPGVYDYERAQAERGMFASAFLPDDSSLIPVSSSASDLHLSGIGCASWLGAGDGFRLDALRWLKTHLAGDTAAIYAALLLGFPNQVPKSVQEHWNRAGVTHLLSISGQHLGMVAMAAFFLLCRLCRLRPTLLERLGDQHLALWGALFLAVLYAVVGGLSLPTWRSAIMLSLFFTGIACYRSTDFASALSLAALLILVLEPGALWTAPFQLSFAAMAGIFLLYPRLRALRRWLSHISRKGLDLLFGPSMAVGSRSENHSAWHLAKPFADAFWVSLAANVMVLPLVAYHFHGISIVGFVANTILVPLTGFVVLPIGLISLALYTFSEPLATLCLIPGGWTVDLSEWLIELFSQRSWAYHWVGNVGIASLVFYYVCLGVVMSSRRWRSKSAALGVLILGFSLCSLVPHWTLPTEREQLRERWQRNRAAGRLQVLFVDVGQGTSTLLAFPDGTNMLVDGGGFHDDAFDIGRNVLAPMLWHIGIDRLDLVVLSHDHPDHGNGLRFILSYFKVGSFWESGIRDSHGSSAAHDLATIAARRAIPASPLEEILGEHTIGTCRLRIRHPSLDFLRTRWDGKDLNNASLVVEVDHGNAHVVLPGDMDQSTEDLLLSNAVLPGKVLLAAPHHGSQRSTGPALLDQLRPDAVVFSSGHENVFGFPHQAVLERLRERSIRFHRTDLEGAVWAVSDGDTWSFSKLNEQDDSR